MWRSRSRSQPGPVIGGVITARACDQGNAFVHTCEFCKKSYTTSLMTSMKRSDKVYVEKKGNRSGKERQCCRYIQTVLRIYIACWIFREQLCRQPKKQIGLFVFAFIRTDQVDVRDRVPLCVSRNDRTARNHYCRNCRLYVIQAAF